MKFKSYLNEIDKAFEKQFNIWLMGAQKIIYDHAKKQGKGNKSIEDIYANMLTVKKGKKYWKIISTPDNGPNGSVFAFIDTTNGDVLKAATFKAPAKQARGNIYDKMNGLGSMGPYGPAYLKG